MFDTETIPAELRSRDQWICWKEGTRNGKQTKIPKRPDGSGRNAKANDMATWGAFEEAVETAEANGWGIGFVFSSADPYVGIDLDGCLESTDSPKGWLPALDSLLETFVERSPSGTGLHAIAKDVSIPEWWTNQHNEDDEGVEIYEDGRYFTVTGDALEPASADVTSVEGLTEWLLDTWDVFNDDPPTTRSGGAQRDDTDIDLGVYDVISRASYPEGGRHEHPIHGSSTGSNFMVDEGGETWRCWRHGCTGNALHLFAMQEGLIDCGEWLSRDIATDTWSDVFDVARDRGLIEDDRPERRQETPDIETADGEDADVAVPPGDLSIHDGKYGFNWENHDDDGNVVDSGFDPVCNFVIETKHYLDSYEGPLIDLRIHPHDDAEDAYDVQVSPTAFNEPRKFKEEVVRGRTTWFDPSNRKGVPTQWVLNELRQTVGSQDVPQLKATEFIGLHGIGDDYDEWVTPDGVLTADGWIDEPDHRYYEKGGDPDAQSSLADKWQLHEEGGDQADTDEVREIVEKIGRTRRPDRGLAILGWMYAAPLKPYIHDWEGEFNLLQVTGDSGAGKTSTLELFSQAFGADPAPFGCGDTAFTLEKKFAGSCGLPIWLDEYKPTDLPEGKLKWLHRRLRQITREKVISKGQQSLGEITFRMRAPVVFSGEQAVTESAVQRRTVMTHLTAASTAGDHEQYHCELVGASYTDADGTERVPRGHDLSQHALAYYRYILGLDEETLRDWWADARSDTKAYLNDLGIGGLNETEVQGLQTVVFGHRVFTEFADEYDASASELPGEDDLKRAVEHVAMNIGPEGKRREHIDEFVEVMSQAASAGYLEDGVHHRVVASQKWEKDVLAFHMPTTFSAVRKYLREFNLEGDYTILGKSDYMDSLRDKADEGESYALAVNKRVRGIENGGKAVFIDPDGVRSKLGEDFVLSAFLEDDEGVEQAAGDSDDDSGGGATPIAELEPGHATIEGELAAHVEPKPWLQDEGTLRDESGVIDYVARGQGAPSQEMDEGGRYRLEDVKVETNQDGVLQLEIRAGVTKIKKVTEEADGDQAYLSDVEDGQPTAADGGDATAVDDDLEGLQARVVQHLARNGDEPQSAGAIAGALDENPADVEDALGHAANKGRVLRQDGGYIAT